MDLDTLNLPPEVKQEIEDFASEVERLERGEVGEEDFKRFRLQQGIYGQRQEDVQMVRTKLPFGRITSDQLNCLADFGKNYSNGILHVTTRQDIQFHYVKIKDVPQGLQDLAEHGLTSREACGNTVRNVTACHKAGTCKEEKFDVTPYAGAVSKYLLRHPLTQNLARKFKISLGGCKGCGLGPIHDIGMNAEVKDGVRGFKVIIGGGLGSSPHLAKLLSEFVPADEILRTCEAIVQVFDQHGDKRNRNKARFKFVVEKYGVEKVRALVQEEFKKLKGDRIPRNRNSRRDRSQYSGVFVQRRYGIGQRFRAVENAQYLRTKAERILQRTHQTAVGRPDPRRGPGHQQNCLRLCRRHSRLHRISEHHDPLGETGSVRSHLQCS